MAGRKRLSTQDWTAAALEALAAGGVGAVAVEPIAARLGTTKGSFYWHFSGRDALLAAALQEWERIATDQVITLIEGEPDLRRRLRLLLAVALGHAGGPYGGRIELALQPSAAHPLVAPALARVTRRRLDYLTAMFRGLGFAPDAARQRSLLAYSAYLGHAQLAHTAPELAPSADALPAYVDATIDALTAP
ncbi:TetR family transcriptional regulator [Pseudonocardia sp. CNS-139]|nr:TetR family transcriptional regulator [Pseudonocardia sp. CNS-139]